MSEFCWLLRTVCESLLDSAQTCVLTCEEVNTSLFIYIVIGSNTKEGKSAVIILFPIELKIGMKDISKVSTFAMC